METKRTALNLATVLAHTVLCYLLAYDVAAQILTPSHSDKVDSSKKASVKVFDFPNELAKSDDRKIVRNPLSNEKLYSNEVIVGFVQGTSDKEARTILEAEKMTAIGRIAELEIFQVEIVGDGSAKGVYDAIKKLQTYKEVKFAEPNMIGQFLEKEGD